MYLYFYFVMYLVCMFIIYYLFQTYFNANAKVINYKFSGVEVVKKQNNKITSE